MNNEMSEILKITEQGRFMLKPDWTVWNHGLTGQGRGLAPPNTDYYHNTVGEAIPLPKPDFDILGSKSFIECAESRKSIRKYRQDALSQNELSFLLWETAKIKEQRNQWSRRPVPSAGGRHCIKTYLYIDRVENIEKGIYVYQPENHELLLVCNDDDLREKLRLALYDQDFDSAVVFLWAAVPYIMEYRYSTVSHKMIAFEAGHICQSLHLAAEAIDCGSCAISAFLQKDVDAVVHVDGENEFVLYVATLGKKI